MPGAGTIEQIEEITAATVTEGAHGQRDHRQCEQNRHEHHRDRTDEQQRDGGACTPRRATGRPSGGALTHEDVHATVSAP
ncbi:hypothetical protein GCM10027169_14570 [Gordonia jinhuaensis]